MQRAALVVLEDQRGLLRWPTPRIDLATHEPNPVVIQRYGRDRGPDQRLALGIIGVELAGHAWTARAYGDDVVVDDSALLSGGARALADGDVVGWPPLGLTLRFEHVSGRMLENRVAFEGALVLDCTTDPVALWGTWPALRRTPSGRIERAVAVSRDAAVAVGAGPVFEPGVVGAPLRVLAARGPGFEPSVALHIAARAAHVLARPRRDGADVPADCLVVTWEGAVAALPPRRSAPASSGFGAVVELLGRMLPDDAVVRAHEPARGVWSTLVEPWLHALSSPHEPVATPPIDDVVRTLDAAVAASRPVTADELATIARQLCPASWAREQELREEIATLDSDAFDALVADASPRTTDG